MMTNIYITVLKLGRPISISITGEILMHAVLRGNVSYVVPKSNESGHM